MRGPLLRRLAPPRHPRRPRPGLHHHDPHRPKSACAGMTLYQVLHELQIVLALILGACPLCTQPLTIDRLATILTPTYQSTTRALWCIPALRDLWRKWPLEDPVPPGAPDPPRKPDAPR